MVFPKVLLFIQRILGSSYRQITLLGFVLLTCFAILPISARILLLTAIGGLVKDEVPWLIALFCCSWLYSYLLTSVTNFIMSDWLIQTIVAYAKGYFVKVPDPESIKHVHVFEPPEPLPLLVEAPPVQAWVNFNLPPEIKTVLSPVLLTFQVAMGLWLATACICLLYSAKPFFRILLRGFSFPVRGAQKIIHECFVEPVAQPTYQPESFRAGSAYSDMPVESLPGSIFSVYSRNSLGVLNYVGSGFRMNDNIYTAKHVLDAALRLGSVVLKKGDIEINTPAWVEVYQDIAAAPYSGGVTGLQLRAAKPAQITCGNQGVAISCLPNQNASFGSLTYCESPIFVYNGSTRGGFSGCPIYESISKNSPILGIHLAGGAQNLCVSAQFLSLLTLKSLTPYKDIVRESVGEDSGERLLKSAVRSQVKLHPSGDPDEVIVEIGRKFYQVDKDVYNSWNRDQEVRGMRYESAVEKNEPTTFSIMENVVNPIMSKTTPIDLMASSNPLQDSVGHNPLVTALTSLLERISSLDNKLSTLQLPLPKEKLAESLHSQSSQTEYPKPSLRHSANQTFSTPCVNSKPHQPLDLDFSKITQLSETLLDSMESTLAKINNPQETTSTKQCLIGLRTSLDILEKVTSMKKKLAQMTSSCSSKTSHCPTEN